MKKICINVLYMISIIFILAWLLLTIKYYRVDVPTGSMLNTIQCNQQLLILKDKYVKSYNRGDIVVFLQDNGLIIKRLIGLPGETIRISNGTVFVDGKLLFEDYLSSNTDFDNTFYVPENKYLFLGDNRAESFDARQWAEPYVSANMLRGKAAYFILPKIAKVSEVTYE